MVDGRVVPAKDVVALEDMLLDALAFDSTVALAAALEAGDSAEVDAALDAADVVLVLPALSADVAEAEVETPAVEEGLKSALPGEATTPEPAPEDEPAVFDAGVEDTPLVKEDWM
jgi:uroporphyrinogen-III decarboxylase